MFGAKLPCQLRPGHVLNGKYRIEAELGSGGFGCVYAAENLNLHTPVAIKLRREPGPDPRLWREARLAAGLQSPNSVRVFDVDRLADGTPYIVMEFLRGRTLREYLRDARKVPLERAVLWGLQICSALGEAHAAGLVHRDIKPSNLFLVETGEPHALVKLVDFGLAKHVEDTGYDAVTESDVVVGSPAYMAPERVRADVGTAQTDIWSVGVVLFEMLSGELPFEGGSNSALLASIVTDPPRPLREVAPELPAALGAIIARCLRKRPEDRYASVDSLAYDLRRLDRDAPAHPPSDESVTVSATIAKRPSRSGAERRLPSRGPSIFAAGLLGVPLMVWLFSLLGAPNSRSVQGVRGAPAPLVARSGSASGRTVASASASSIPERLTPVEPLDAAPHSSDVRPHSQRAARQTLPASASGVVPRVPERRLATAFQPQAGPGASAGTSVRARASATPRLFVEPDF